MTYLNVYNMCFLNLDCQGQRRLCHVRVPFFIADEKDLASCITGMYASGQANRPCNVCESVFKSSILESGSLRDLDFYAKVQTSFLILFACLWFHLLSS